MDIVAPYARIQNIQTTVQAIEQLRQIEWCGRISHRSEDAQTDTSYEKFLRAVVLGHGDWSIVEHSCVIVDAIVDRGITHEWVRHRIGAYTQECVAGSTRILRELTIAEAYQRQLVGQVIRSSNGREIVRNRIVHIYDKGVQPVYEVRTALGYSIKATQAHEFQIPSDTLHFQRLETLHVGEKIMVNGRPCLLPLSDEQLREAFFMDGLSPAEIAKTMRAPYSSVTRRLRLLGVHNDRRNDTHPEKYNKNHTPASYQKMSASIREGYRNGREVWNKGLSEADDEGVRAQAETLRANHWDNGRQDANSMWKGGVKGLGRAEAERKKAHLTHCEVCTSTNDLHVHHIDENPTHDDDENLVKLCRTCHRRMHANYRVGTIPVADTIVSITYVGREPTYDLEMATHHNYIANGFVVHNSTRFVNYAKKHTATDEYVNPAKFICPPSILACEGTEKHEIYQAWCLGRQADEHEYLFHIANGIKPQEARTCFPNALASRIVSTYNLRNWRHFLLMRTTREAHPQMREVTIPLLDSFQSYFPVLFEDIEPLAKQSDNMKKMR